MITMSKVRCNSSCNRTYPPTTINSQHSNRQQQQQHKQHQQHHLLHQHQGKHFQAHLNRQKFYKNNNADVAAHSNSIFNQLPSANTEMMGITKISSSLTIENSDIKKSSTYSTAAVLSSVPKLIGQNYRKSLLYRNRVRMAMHQYCNKQQKQIFQKEQYKNNNEINGNNVIEEDKYEKNCHKEQHLRQHRRVVKVVNNDVDELLTTGTCVTSTATITCKYRLEFTLIL